jgi:hypothetical protein
MLKSPDNCSLNERLERILRMPCEENHLYPHHHDNKLYSKLMVEGILQANAKPENFLEILSFLVDCRLHAALITNDNPVANALSDFGFNRLYGKKPDKQSFTAIKKDNDPLAGLGGLIKSRIFNCAENGAYISADDLGNTIYCRRYLIAETEHTWTFSIKRLVDGTIEIHHAYNRDVPFILEHLSRLWALILTAGDFQGKIAFLAEFEWWFMASNITARSGAGIGDALSIILQRQTNINIRHKFIHLDWEALSRSLKQYVAWRTKKYQKRILTNEFDHNQYM